MARTKRFMAVVKVNGNVIVGDSSRIDVTTQYELRRCLDEDGLVGPRGGRYVRSTPITFLPPQQVGDDWARNLWSCIAECDGRYVRPQATR